MKITLSALSGLTDILQFLLLSVKYVPLCSDGFSLGFKQQARTMSHCLLVRDAELAKNSAWLLEQDSEILSFASGREVK